MRRSTECQRLTPKQFTHAHTGSLTAGEKMKLGVNLMFETGVARSGQIEPTLSINGVPCTPAKKMTVRACALSCVHACECVQMCLHPFLLSVHASVRVRSPPVGRDGKAFHCWFYAGAAAIQVSGTVRACSSHSFPPQPTHPSPPKTHCNDQPTNNRSLCASPPKRRSRAANRSTSSTRASVSVCVYRLDCCVNRRVDRSYIQALTPHTRPQTGSA